MWNIEEVIREIFNQTTFILLFTTTPQSRTEQKKKKKNCSKITYSEKKLRKQKSTSTNGSNRYRTIIYPTEPHPREKQGPHNRVVPPESPYSGNGRGGGGGRRGGRSAGRRSKGKAAQDENAHAAGERNLAEEVLQHPRHQQGVLLQQLRHDRHQYHLLCSSNPR
ncbi:hypothetical protein AXF42_Ash000032 [Apostasia shenzhenica]|uniref:Uncharacterized protein n=1 Tax=Apostasia shenzhenica TaxID=1088818 RepID=A0A2I0AF69_9ASPA|nr:hypothetical protein AXF42_Ash000032 [Apostasia shenzhenica]